MMPAAKHGDPQVGVDIHLCIVPPSPSPVPLPTPHMSIVFDVFDYIPRIGATRGTATGSWSPYASTFVGLGVNQELFDFGRIAAQAAAADALTDVERQRTRSVTLDDAAVSTGSSSMAAMRLLRDRTYSSQIFGRT